MTVWYNWCVERCWQRVALGCLQGNRDFTVVLTSLATVANSTYVQWSITFVLVRLKSMVEPKLGDFHDRVAAG